MRRQGVVLAVAAVAAALVAATPAPSPSRVSYTITQMNDSGTRGRAVITVGADGSLHVRVRGAGFIPNTPHPQHLHGAAGQRHYFCPPASVDQNGDGQVATEEAENQYGGITVSLTTTGDTSLNSALALERMPVADAQGNLDYERTIPAQAVPEGMLRSLPHMHLVLHGVDVNGNGRYDMAGLGESVFASAQGVDGIPEELTNPSACGEATPVGSVETGSQSTRATQQRVWPFAAAALLTLGLILLARRSVRNS
jgi:hypothetical protein